MSSNFNLPSAGVNGSMFGSTPSKEGNNTPAFTFGAKTDATKPAINFSFGTNQPTDTTKPAASTGFSFGSGSTLSTGAAPSFSFGAAKTEEKKDDKPAFSFGASSAASTAVPSFGGLGSSNPASTPGAPSFSFGGAAKPADSKPALSFGGFGAKTEEKKDTQAAAAPAPSFSFGAAKPEEKKDAVPSFSFGATKPAVTTTAPAATSSLGGFSLGGKTEEKNDPAKPASGGFSFGAPKADEKKDVKPAAGGFSFGAAKTEEKKNDKPAATAGFSFGATEKKEDKPSVTTTAAPGGFSFGAKPTEKKDDDKEKKTVTFSNSVIDRDEKKEATKTIEPQPVSLNNKTLEDLISKWTNQLTKASSSFQSYSTKINEWDRVLVDGGEKISQLYTDVVSAEQTQNKIEQQLLYVERQQTELETFLDNYESKAEALLSDVLSSNNQQRDSTVVTNDQKREQAYRTAELLDENLNSLGLNLSSLINEINEVSDSFNKANGLGASKGSNTQDDESTLYQVVKLLNTHLDALNRIQKNSDEVNSKLDQFKGMGI